MMDRRDIWDHNGKILGYPNCCIKSFCNGRRTKEQTDVGLLGHGFIPCQKHALQIVAGSLKIEDLIHGRDPELPPFPDYKM